MDTNSESIIYLSSTQAERVEFDWGYLIWNVSRELGNSTDITVGQCHLMPGFANPRHYHPNCSESLTVLSGYIRHTMGPNEDVEMGPGDTVTIPPNIWHRAENIGKEKAVLLICFSSADRKTIGE